MDKTYQRNDRHNLDKETLQVMIIVLMVFCCVFCRVDFSRYKCCRNMDQLWKRKKKNECDEQKLEDMHKRNDSMKELIKKGIAVGIPVSNGKMPIVEAIFSVDDEEQLSFNCTI